ncbi:MAG: hypothetical protein JKY66_03855 [Spongiibacteraceae bacterium]|nr:hypothetical protein [Spongiibacteraceae bacterium]
MLLFRRFLRYCSIQRLQDYFVEAQLPVSGIDWSEDQATVVSTGPNLHCSVSLKIGERS